MSCILMFLKVSYVRDESVIIRGRFIINDISSKGGIPSS